MCGNNSPADLDPGAGREAGTPRRPDLPARPAAAAEAPAPEQGARDANSTHAARETRDGTAPSPDATAPTPADPARTPAASAGNAGHAPAEESAEDAARALAASLAAGADHALAEAPAPVPEPVKAARTPAAAYRISPSLTTGTAQPRANGASETVLDGITEAGVAKIDFEEESLTTQTRSLKRRAQELTDRDFMQALRRWIGDTIAHREAEDEREDSPRLVSWEMLTLLLMALNVASALRYLRSVDAEDVSNAYQIVEVVVPALLGTALVAYLDQARDFVLKLARSRLTTAIAAILLVALVAPHTLNFRVPVHVSPGAELVLGGSADPVVFGEGDHVLEIDAFKPVALTVRDYLASTPEEGSDAVEDKVTLGLRHLLRSEAAEWRLPRYLWGEYRIELAPVYPVTIEADSAGAELVAEGRFPELFLLKKAKRKNGNLRFAPDSGRIRLPLRLAIDDVDLPPGTYDLRLFHPGRRCTQRLRTAHTVFRGDTTVVRFTGLACEPFNGR